MTFAGAGVRRESGADLLPGAAIGGSFGAMLLIGAMTAFYGPLIPYLETRYGISRATAGAVLGADFGGSLAGVLWAIWAVRRLPNRGYLLIALGAVVAGSALLATASGWWQVLAGAAVAGGGFGVLDFSLNRLFTLAFEGRRGAMLNVLNAIFGGGAVLGPLAVALLARHHLPWIFAGTAVLAAVVAPLIALVRDDRPAAAPKARARRPSLTVCLFTAAYLLYMGAEAGVSGWSPTHLKAVGYSATFADAVTSAFWLCLTIGRFLIVPVTLRVSPRRIVLGGIGAACAVLLLSLVTPFAPYGYALAGLALAPVWPTGLAWLAETHPDGPAISYLLVASMLGGAVFPYATGWIITAAGARATPAVLAAFAAAGLTSFTLIPRVPGRPGER
jgi:MFS transporter, FHS family, glucose/mannose:H+ symporter